MAAARELTKDWDGVDVQELPPTPIPIAASAGVALSLRTFRWLQDRDCVSSRRLSRSGSTGSGGGGDGGGGDQQYGDSASGINGTQLTRQRRWDSRAGRRGALRPPDPPCIATALFLDWGGLGYFSTVAKKQGVALATTHLVVLMVRGYD